MPTDRYVDVEKPLEQTLRTAAGSPRNPQLPATLPGWLREALHDRSAGMNGVAGEVRGGSKFVESRP